MRPSLLPALFGSAVLGALIGLASSYLTARMTIAANLQLEREKATFRIEEDRAREQIKAYQTLAIRLEDLHSAYVSYQIFTRAASVHGMDKEDRATLTTQREAVGKSEREVIAAERDLNVAGTNVSKEMAGCLTDLTMALSAARLQPLSVLNHRDIDGRLADLSNKARQEADHVRMPIQ